MTPPSTPRERVPYSAIVDRPPLVLPGDARMIVWTIVNVEDWGIERPMPRTVLSPPMGQPLLPDLPNWAWHEYGMRVGFWRFLERCRNSSIKATLRSTARLPHYARVAQAAQDAGWEFMGHGLVQTPMHKVEDQRAAIRDTVEAIRDVYRQGAARLGEPRPDRNLRHARHLAEAGIEYVADWCSTTSRSYRDRARAGALDSVHGRVERHCDDGVAAPFGRGDAGPRPDHFDRLYRRAPRPPRHGDQRPSLHLGVAAPHRLPGAAVSITCSASTVWCIWTGEQILDWFRAQVPPTR